MNEAQVVLFSASRPPCTLQGPNTNTSRRRINKGAGRRRRRIPPPSPSLALKAANPFVRDPWIQKPQEAGRRCQALRRRYPSQKSPGCAPSSRPGSCGGSWRAAAAPSAARRTPRPPESPARPAGSGTPGATSRAACGAGWRR
ncbi:hypothetical protein ON010_g9469 [Phytophthora cinnamomi]|nr:hypothetical protein ON010_g9469 [Phytophthora cinnamomi]